MTAPSGCLNLTFWAALGEKPGCRVKLPRRTKKDSRSRMASEIAKFTEIVMPIYIIRLVSGAEERLSLQC